MAAPGGSVCTTSDQGRPGSQGRFSAYDNVTSGWGPGISIVAVGSRPGESNEPSSASTTL